MSVFPSEIINHIASFLPFTACITAQQINREWYTSIAEMVKERYEKIPWTIGVYYVNSGNESRIYNAFICMGRPVFENFICYDYTPSGRIVDLRLVFLHGKGGDLLRKESLLFDINMVHSTITLVSDSKKRQGLMMRRFDINHYRIIGNLDHTDKFEIPVSRDWYEEPSTFGEFIPETPVYSYHPQDDSSSGYSEDTYSDYSDSSDDEMDDS